MSIQRRELINIVSELSEVESLKVTIKESFKGACITAACAFVGSVLGGPIGLGIGGTVGAIGSAYAANGTYKSAAEILRNDLTVQQQEQLTESIMSAVQQIELTDVARVATLLMTNYTLKELVIKEVVTFLKNEMGLAIQ